MGGKEAEFVKYFREAHVLDKYLGIFVNCICFSRDNVYKRIKAKAKCDFLI